MFSRLVLSDVSSLCAVNETCHNPLLLSHCPVKTKGLDVFIVVVSLSYISTFVGVNSVM